MTLSLESTCRPSEDIVAREIQGEIVLVPLTSGMGETDDEIYTLNEVGRAIWTRLDGKRSLGDVVKELTAEYQGSPEEIEKNVIGFSEELAKRKMLVDVRGNGPNSPH